MKNPLIECLRLQARQYHRHHTWELENHGIHVRHEYQPERALSWWGDYGFVLNGRRVMIWWEHPRMKCADEIADRAWKEAGPLPAESDGLLHTTTIWRNVGRSRKKVCAHQSSPTPDAWRAHYDRVSAHETRLRNEGIAFEVVPSMSIQALNWCTGIDLSIPMEIRNHDEARELVLLTKRLLKREITLAESFPSYQYGRVDWLAESADREKDRAMASENS